MSVYLLYSYEDAEFAEKLSEDLVAHGVEHARADRNTDERFSALHKAEKVIVVLSNHVLSDVRVLSTLSAAHDIKTDIIALRIGQVDSMPKQLKGIFPLDFSNPRHYDEALETLLEDIAPSQLNYEPAPAYLPVEVQGVLDNLELSSLKQRRSAIETLGHYRDEEDQLLRHRAKDALGELVFKEKDGNLKRLASITLQSFDGERETALEIEPPEPDKFVADLPDGDEFEVEDVAILQTAEPITHGAGLLQLPTQEIWQTQNWLIQTHVVGIISALVLIGLLNMMGLGLALGLVYIGLAWFNVQIRANGDFVWHMPGPMIGNGLLGLILSLIGAGIGSVIDEQSFNTSLGIVVLSVTNGAFIGWLSTLRTQIL